MDAIRVTATRSGNGVMTLALYAGRVQHTRLQPVRHKLSYRVFMGLFDLDDLAETSRRVWAFSYNRPGLISFYDRDHGDGSGRPLRDQIEAKLLEAGIVAEIGAIRALCMPRLLGYVFNPISAFFCYDRNGVLAAIVHEVNNTFGERHFYALPVSGGREAVRQECAKRFRVSPFLPMELDYKFRIAPPSERVGLSICVSKAHEPILHATFQGVRSPFTSSHIVRQWLAHPALTLKVITAIHWEAVLIWLRLRRQRGRAGTPKPA
jgi:DUF1365 family protein